MDMIEHSSEKERIIRNEFTELLKNNPLPDDELLMNLGLYLTSKNLARLLFFYEIYKKIVTRHGIIIEFGTRWGQNISLLSALRGIFEPFNRTRKIVGFDTFSGFIEDTDKPKYGVVKGYEEYLEKILYLQEKHNPLDHIKKFEIIKGNVKRTLPKYLKNNPETLVSLTIFDMDLYKPTKSALENIIPYLYSGSILVFDNVCDEMFPGETIALKEVLDLRKVSLQRMPMASRITYMEYK